MNSDPAFDDPTPEIDELMSGVAKPTDREFELTQHVMQLSAEKESYLHNLEQLSQDVVALGKENERLHAQIAQLNVQIDLLTDGVLQLEQERDAWQQLAVAHEVQAAPTATMLLEQERAAFHTQMRDMGIPFQEGDHG